MKSAIAVAVLALAGCRAAPAPELSPHAVVLDLPLVKQDELYQCGLVSVSALAEFWGRALDPTARAALARLAVEKHGLSGAELCEALEKLGLETFLFEGALDRSNVGLLHHIDLGRPLLVMTSASPETHHYILFLGYDPDQRLVVLLDPLRGRVLEPTEVFERSWSAAERFTLLALPRNQTSP